MVAACIRRESVDCLTASIAVMMTNPRQGGLPTQTLLGLEIKQQKVMLTTKGRNIVCDGRGAEQSGGVKRTIGATRKMIRRIAGDLLAPTCSQAPPITGQALPLKIGEIDDESMSERIENPPANGWRQHRRNIRPPSDLAQKLSKSLRQNLLHSQVRHYPPKISDGETRRNNVGEDEEPTGEWQPT